jgi:hypothetical protein
MFTMGQKTRKMGELVRPKKVLCKRGYTSGKDHWWDKTVSPPERRETDNRWLIEGEWYEVVFNEHDCWNDKKKTFSILNNQGNRSLYYMYTDEDKENWPEGCDMYGPRDYSKWFYTPEELELLEKGEYNPSYKERNAIEVMVGSYHWVKLKRKPKNKTNQDWVIARATSKAKKGHKWTLIGSVGECDESEIAEIGEIVDSRETQMDKDRKLESYKNLIDVFFPLVDSLNNPGGDEFPPVEYHKPFVEKAVRKYFDDAYKRIKDSDIFY